MDYYKTLDLLLHIVHSGLVLFMLFGAFFRPLVKWHLIFVIIIWTAWLAIGSYVGTIGYCPLTEWHWQIKTQLGEGGLPPSYIEYVYADIIGRGVDDKLMSNIIAAAMLMITLFSTFRFATIRNRPLAKLRN